MRNVAWSVVIVGLMSSTAMAQVPAQPPAASWVTVAPAAAARAASAATSDDQAPAGQPPAPGGQQTPAGQPPADTPAPKRLTVAAGIDFPTAYMFRGIYQEDEGFIAQPFVDLGVALYSGDGALSAVSANVGNWNSIHHSAPSGGELHDRDWYEADYYGSVTFTFGKFKSGALYTAYTSPNDAFNSVQELAAVFAYDDSAGAFSLNPKVILAFELDGQADGGDDKGTYLELGIRPSIKLGTSPASLSIPVKLGLSASDYYEGSTGSNTFGYFDTGFIVGLALPATGKVSWELHGGVDLLWFGDNLKILNDDDGFKPVGLIGFSMTY